MKFGFRNQSIILKRFFSFLSTRKKSLLIADHHNFVIALQVKCSLWSLNGAIIVKSKEGLCHAQ